jgi:hypothetical protein
MVTTHAEVAQYLKDAGGLRLVVVGALDAGQRSSLISAVAPRIRDRRE